MYTIEDLKFLSTIKLHVDKTLSPRYLHLLQSKKLNTPTDVVSVLSGFDALFCIQSQLRLDSLPNLSTIYGKLINCWVRQLEDLITLIKPSSLLRELITVFMNRYAMNALFYSLESSEREIFQLPLAGDIAGAVKESKKFKDLVERLEGLHRKELVVVIKVLKKYMDKNVIDVDPHKLYLEFTSEYYNVLRNKVAEKFSRATQCVELLKIAEDILINLRKSSKEGAKQAISRLPLNVQSAIEEALSDSLKIELLLGTALLGYCDTPLALESFTKGTMLRYLLLKDWEAKIISFLLNTIDLGYGSAYISGILEKMVRSYELLNK